MSFDWTELTKVFLSEAVKYIDKQQKEKETELVSINPRTMAIINQTATMEADSFIQSKCQEFIEKYIEGRKFEDYVVAMFQNALTQLQSDEKLINKIDELVDKRVQEHFQNK